MYRAMGRFSDTYGLVIVLNPYMRHFFWVFILICLILSLCLIYLKILPCAHTLLAKMHSTKEDYGWLSITPLLTSEELSSLEGLFDISK